MRGIPLGPSGYRERAAVGMNDELDEASPISGVGAAAASWRGRVGAAAAAGKERAEEVGCCRPSAASAAVEQFPLFVFVSSLSRSLRALSSVKIR